MKTLLFLNSLRIALVVFLTAMSCFAQGQILFANKFGTSVNAPVFLNASPQSGPGPGYSAQLNLQTADGSLTPLTPISTFQPADTGVDAMADRYWDSKLVNVSLNPGTEATFVVRVWRTSFGSYEAAVGAADTYGQSAPFMLTVGGGNLPPATLTTLQSFGVGIFPEPSTVAIGVLGAVVLLFCRRR
jgi:hypothetical protein